MKRRLTGNFPAHDDRGKSYLVIEYTTYTKTAVMNGPSIMIDGAKEFELADGSPVRQMGPNHYEISATGVVLRPDAPNAP